MSVEQGIQRELVMHIASFYDDPLGHVLFSYPWGQGQLQGRSGPQDWQREFLEDVGEQVRARRFDGVNAVAPLQYSTSSGHGIGKGMPLQTVLTIPMSDGSGKITGMRKMKWGDVKVGDYVFGADGKPTKVVATNHYRREHYRVTFDDRSSVVVSGEHEWAARGRGERRFGKPGWRIMETQELLRVGVKRPNGKAMARQWEIPIQGAAEFAPAVGLPLDPYVMGVWLSDGHQNRITKRSPAVRAELRARHHGDVNDHAGFATVGLTKVDWGSLDVFQCRSWEKYIPDVYKYASVEQREALFRGLMDGDGEVYRSGSCGYSSTSERLLDDVVWLARSLGYKATKQASSKRSHYTYDGEKREGRPCYRATIQPIGNPFTHEERKARFKPADEDRYRKRWIDSIEPVGMADGMCIEVEAADHLYLTEDFHVTHNSAIVAWLIRWIMDTRPFAKGVVTANTGEQLRTKTWSELAKWHHLGITRHWWQLNAGAGSMNYYHKDFREQWRCDAQTSREENSEAFAGLHAANSTPFYIFDEASGIPDKIFEVREGGLTDGEPMTFDFGNPTRNTGRFYQNMEGRFRNRYHRRWIDSRDVEQTNKELFRQWAEDYGEESDFFKVRVRGMFPDAGSLQLIPMSLYEDNVGLDVRVQPHDPLVMAVDVARFGDDRSVIWMRQGRDASSQNDWRTQILQKVDTMQLSARIAEIANAKRPDAILIDGGGVGGGVIDRCRQLGLDVIEVNFGAKATQLGMANMRAQMWANLRDALKSGVRLPDMEDLRTDLTSVEYGYTLKNELKLESKEDMKKRGLASPDLGDALALTYALPVYPNRVGFLHQSVADENGGDYDPW